MIIGLHCLDESEPLSPAPPGWGEALPTQERLVFNFPELPNDDPLEVFKKESISTQH